MLELRRSFPPALRLLRHSAVLGGLAALGCSGTPASLVPEIKVARPAKAQCNVDRGHEFPMIVEWPAAERLALENSAKSGVIAVAYEGCSLKVLRQCKAAFPYVYSSTTRQDDRLVIRDEDHLYANLPVFAASFEAALERSGGLTVQSSMVGVFSSKQPAFGRESLEGECKSATHFIASITTGAFEFSTGTQSRAQAGAEVMNAKAGAESSSSREVLNRAGVATACDRAAANDTAPPFNCGAFVGIELRPIAKSKAPAVSPQQLAATAANETNAARAKVDLARDESNLSRQIDLATEALMGYRRAAAAWEAYRSVSKIDIYETNFWIADALTLAISISELLGRPPLPADIAAAEKAARAVIDDPSDDKFRQTAAFYLMRIADTALSVQYGLYAKTAGAQGLRQRAAVDFKARAAQAQPEELPGLVLDAVRARDLLVSLPYPHPDQSQQAVEAARLLLRYHRASEAQTRATPVHEKECGSTDAGYEAWKVLVEAAVKSGDRPLVTRMIGATGDRSCARTPEQRQEQARVLHWAAAL
jgi:hypothetical protein